MTIEQTIADTTTGSSTTTSPQTTDSPQSTSKRTKEDTLTKDQTAGTIICTNVVNRDNSIPYHCQPDDINENMYNN